jgi:hypothetical protein
MPIITRPSKKLSNRFLGPYKITKKISSHAYRLGLPSHSKIHDVFHISKLEPFKENTITRLNPRSLKAKRNSELRKSLTPRSINGTRNLYVTSSNGPDMDQTRPPGRHLHGSPTHRNASRNITKNTPSNQVHNHQLLRLPPYTKTTQGFDTPSQEPPPHTYSSHILPVPLKGLRSLPGGCCYGPAQLGLHTTYNLQRATYNVQPTTYNLQHTTYNVPPTTYHLQHTAHNVQPTTYSLQRTAYNVPSTLSQVQCTPLHLLPTNATTWLHCTQHNGSLTLSPTQCTAHNVLSLPFLPFNPQRTPHNVNAQCNYTL